MSGSNVFTGTLDLLMLQALESEPLHGYAIGRWLRQQSRDVLRIEEGALYPALHRLERQRLVAARWGASELGRQAKFYRLTAAGRRRLAAERDRWREHATAVEAVLGAQRSRA